VKEWGPCREGAEAGRPREVVGAQEVHGRQLGHGGEENQTRLREPPHGEEDGGEDGRHRGGHKADARVLHQPPDRLIIVYQCACTHYTHHVFPPGFTLPGIAPVGECVRVRWYEQSVLDLQ